MNIILLRSRYIFAQLVIFAGTEPAVTFVVDNVKELVLEIDFYSVIVANVRSPAAIPKILVGVNSKSTILHITGSIKYCLFHSIFSNTEMIENYCSDFFIRFYSF